MIPATAAIVGVTLIVLGLLARAAHREHCAARLEALRIEAEDEAAEKALVLASEAAAAVEGLRKRIEAVADEARQAGLSRLGRSPR